MLASAAALLALAACEKKHEAATSILTVAVAPAEQQDVYETNTWVGLLNGYQNAEIRAQVTGYLQTQNYKEGSLVKKGDVLFTIDQRPFLAALAQAKATYAEALAKAQLSQTTLTRQTELFQTKVISQQEFDAATQTAQADLAAAAAAEANVEAAQINLNYCTIIAPFDGIVGAAQAQIGDLVGPGGTASVLTQMSQVNPIKAVFSITEQQYLQAHQLLKELQNKNTEDREGRITLTLADGTVYPHKGRFDFVDRQVNVTTGTIQVTALFPNDDGVLRPGLFARITAPVRLLKDAILIPQQAVVELQGHHLVSIVTADNIVQTKPVVLGPTQGPMQVILQGLAAGDRVIVEGVEKVRPGMKVNVQPYQPGKPSPQALALEGAKGGNSPSDSSPTPSPTPEATSTASPSPTPKNEAQP